SPLFRYRARCGYSSWSSAAMLNVMAPAVTSTLSLHDALPISIKEIDVLQFRGDLYLTATRPPSEREPVPAGGPPERRMISLTHPDRKSTRLNSSHVKISYAVFCLKKKTLACAGASRRRSEEYT